METQPNAPRRGRHGRGRRVRWSLLVGRLVAAALSVTVLATSGYGWAAYRTVSDAVTHVDGLTADGQNGHDQDGAAQDILLVGDDHRPAGASQALLNELSTQDDGGAENTDTMMLMHVPAGGGSATVISFPRDSWVDIPGHGKGKLNSAFSLGAADGGGDAGGMQLLIRTIQQLTGVPIDHFVRISLLGFYEVANALGPVQVCLNAAVDDPYSGTVLPAGVSTLDAKQALSFVRQRHGVPHGDLGRVARQQYFLSLELQKVLSTQVLLDPRRLSALLRAVGNAVQTDPTFDLLDFAGRFGDLTGSDVHFLTLPWTGTPTITDDAGNRVSIVQLDLVALPAFLAEVLGEPAAYTSAVPAPPSTVAVQVVDGRDVEGSAAQAADALTALGFPTPTIGELPPPVIPDGVRTTTLTTVTYPVGMEAQGKAVAQAVPGAAVAPSTSDTQVTLTLGTDGLTVTGTPARPADPADPAAAPTSSPVAPAATPTCVD